MYSEEVAKELARRLKGRLTYGVEQNRLTMEPPVFLALGDVSRKLLVKRKRFLECQLASLLVQLWPEYIEPSSPVHAIAALCGTGGMPAFKATLTTPNPRRPVATEIPDLDYPDFPEEPPDET